MQIKTTRQLGGIKAGTILERETVQAVADVCSGHAVAVDPEAAVAEARESARRSPLIEAFIAKGGVAVKGAVSDEHALKPDPTPAPLTGQRGTSQRVTGGGGVIVGTPLGQPRAKSEAPLLGTNLAGR